VIKSGTSNDSQDNSNLQLLSSWLGLVILSCRIGATPCLDMRLRTKSSSDETSGGDEVGKSSDVSEG